MHPFFSLVYLTLPLPLPVGIVQRMHPFFSLVYLTLPLPLPVGIVQRMHSCVSNPAQTQLDLDANDTSFRNTRSTLNFIEFDIH